MTSAIIVAAGSSRRMGFDKLFAELAGRPVLAHTLAAFQSHPEIDEVIAVTSESNRPAIEALDLADRIVPGGLERHHSVWNGLESAAPGTRWVAVHDGARPLVSAEAITDCLAVAREKGAAACARRVTETVKRADEDGRVTGAVDREGLWIMETPQCFEIDLLKGAYQQVLEAGALVTDEVSAIETTGQDVFLVENRSPNLKITFPPDLELAERLLSHRL